MDELKNDNQKMAFEFTVITLQLFKGQSDFLVVVLQLLHHSGLFRDFILQSGIGLDYCYF